MSILKRLEIWAKLALALVASLLLYRPGRRSWRVEEPRRILLVRIDERIGEALLMTPLCSALKRRYPNCELHLLVHARTARVLEGNPAVNRVRAFNRSYLFLGPAAPGIEVLRREPLIWS